MATRRVLGRAGGGRPGHDHALPPGSSHGPRLLLMHWACSRAHVAWITLVRDDGGDAAEEARVYGHVVGTGGGGASSRLLFFFFSSSPFLIFFCLSFSFFLYLFFFSYFFFLFRLRFLLFTPSPSGLSSGLLFLILFRLHPSYPPFYLDFILILTHPPL